MNHNFTLSQVKRDFENTKKRVLLAQTMKAQGFSREEIEYALEQIRQPDMVDLMIEDMVL